jgi:hypothetical protein
VRLTAREPDPSLRRVQRDSAIITTSAALFALLIQRGRPEGALGVLAGAGLMAFSYAAIEGGVTALLARAAAAGHGASGKRVSKGRVAWILAGFVGRYAVVGFVGWAVLVPLRAHPLGLFAGVTIPVAAVGIEAIRLALAPPGRTGGSAP